MVSELQMLNSSNHELYEIDHHSNEHRAIMVGLIKFSPRCSRKNLNGQQLGDDLRTDVSATSRDGMFRKIPVLP